MPMLIKLYTIPLLFVEKSINRVKFTLEEC